MILLAVLRKNEFAPNPTADSQIGLVGNLGKVLFNEYLLPFELISILFFVAMVGAVMLGKREAGERNF